MRCGDLIWCWLVSNKQYFCVLSRKNKVVKCCSGTSVVFCVCVNFYDVFIEFEVECSTVSDVSYPLAGYGNGKKCCGKKRA